MRRQFSNSATISTGQPARVYTHATSWSLSGPPRTLTRSALTLTKRGTGRPLVVVSPPACAIAMDASVSKATSAVRAPMIMKPLRRKAKRPTPK